MITGNETSIGEAESKKEARAKLREGFLRALNDLNGETCSILTFEKSLLEAEIAGWNLEGDEILVKDLNTPSQSVASALLRTPDVLAVQFKNPLNLP